MTINQKQPTCEFTANRNTDNESGRQSVRSIKNWVTQRAVGFVGLFSGQWQTFFKVVLGHESGDSSSNNLETTQESAYEAQSRVLVGKLSPYHKVIGKFIQGQQLNQSEKNNLEQLMLSLSEDELAHLSKCTSGLFSSLLLHTARFGPDQVFNTINFVNNAISIPSVAINACAHNIEQGRFARAWIHRQYLVVRQGIVTATTQAPGQVTSWFKTHTQQFVCDYRLRHEPALNNHQLCMRGGTALALALSAEYVYGSISWLGLLSMFMVMSNIIKVIELKHSGYTRLTQEAHIKPVVAGTLDRILLHAGPFNPWLVWVCLWQFRLSEHLLDCMINYQRYGVVFNEDQKGKVERYKILARNWTRHAVSGSEKLTTIGSEIYHWSSQTLVPFYQRKVNEHPYLKDLMTLALVHSLVQYTSWGPIKRLPYLLSVYRLWTHRHHMYYLYGVATALRDQLVNPYTHIKQSPIAPKDPAHYWKWALAIQESSSKLGVYQPCSVSTLADLLAVAVNSAQLDSTSTMPGLNQENLISQHIWLIQALISLMGPSAKASASQKAWLGFSAIQLSMDSFKSLMDGFKDLTLSSQRELEVLASQALINHSGLRRMIMNSGLFENSHIRSQHYWLAITCGAGYFRAIIDNTVNWEAVKSLLQELKSFAAYTDSNTYSIINQAEYERRFINLLSKVGSCSHKYERDIGIDEDYLKVIQKRYARSNPYLVCPDRIWLSSNLHELTQGRLPAGISHLALTELHASATRSLSVPESMPTSVNAYAHDDHGLDKENVIPHEHVLLKHQSGTVQTSKADYHNTGSVMSMTVGEALSLLDTDTLSASAHELSQLTTDSVNNHNTFEAQRVMMTTASMEQAYLRLLRKLECQVPKIIEHEGRLTANQQLTDNDKRLLIGLCGTDIQQLIINLYELRSDQKTWQDWLRDYNHVYQPQQASHARTDQSITLNLLANNKPYFNFNNLRGCLENAWSSRDSRRPANASKNNFSINASLLYMMTNHPLNYQLVLKQCGYRISTAQHNAVLAFLKVIKSGENINLQPLMPKSGIRYYTIKVVDWAYNKLWDLSVPVALTLLKKRAYFALIAPLTRFVVRFKTWASLVRCFIGACLTPYKQQSRTTLLSMLTQTWQLGYALISLLVKLPRVGTQILKDIPLLISYSIAKSREKLVWIIKKSFLLVKNTLTQSISWVRDQTVGSFLNKISSKLDVISAKMTSALSLSRVLSAKYTRWLSRIYLTALFILRYSLGFSYFSMIGISMTLPVVKASSVSSFRSVKSLFVRPHPNRLKSDQNESISSSASHIPSAGVSRL